MYVILGTGIVYTFRFFPFVSVNSGTQYIPIYVDRTRNDSAKHNLMYSTFVNHFHNIINFEL